MNTNNFECSQGKSNIEAGESKVCESENEEVVMKESFDICKIDLDDMDVLELSEADDLMEVDENVEVPRALQEPLRTEVTNNMEETRPLIVYEVDFLRYDDTDSDNSETIENSAAIGTKRLKSQIVDVSRNKRNIKKPRLSSYTRDNTWEDPSKTINDDRKTKTMSSEIHSIKRSNEYFTKGFKKEVKQIKTNIKENASISVNEYRQFLLDNKESSNIVSSTTTNFQKSLGLLPVNNKETPLSFPELDEPINDENKPENNVIVTRTMEKCLFWPNCRYGDNCKYFHPFEECKEFPNCLNGQNCNKIHPMCKYNTFCYNPICHFQHPSSHFKKNSASLCRYGSNCLRNTCRYYHPY